MGEKNRLETTLREEETRVRDSETCWTNFLEGTTLIALYIHNLVAQVRKEEADLKLAEQAFDNFLQENDRKAMEAQKKVSLDTFIPFSYLFIIS